MKLPILTHPDERLRRPSEPVAEITPEIRELAHNMLETMYHAEGVGLAAPQVGRNIRLIVVDVRKGEEGAQPEPLFLVNPAVEPLGRETVDHEEGCLSVCDFRSVVRRPARVRLTATDLEGNPVEREAEGLLAICLQHECDHLDGRLFIDRISRLKRSLYDTRLRKKMRQEAK